ncbi:MAG: hypothetical protein ABSD02_09600 [Steroidobacteraceae bacterium]|jgi:hypothetical protein
MKFDAGLVLCSALLSAAAALCTPAQAEQVSSTTTADGKASP